MKYLLCFALLLACACSSDLKHIQKVYDNRKTLIDMFSSQSVIRSRGQNIILYYTYAGKKTNSYSFEINNGTYLLTGDSIEYAPDILHLKQERGTEAYKQELISHVKQRLEKMDELNIRDIKGDLADVGIDLMIYMKDVNEDVLYVSNPGKITGPFWTGYLTARKKLDNNWYYATADMPR